MGSGLTFYSMDSGVSSFASESERVQILSRLYKGSVKSKSILNCVF